jgi:multiple sugar transport system permease protein
MGLAMVLPFFWMVSTSLKTPLEALRFPPTWFPASPQFGNYVEVFRQIPLLLYLGNTVLVALLSLAGVLLTGILAAYAFPRPRSPVHGFPCPDDDTAAGLPRAQLHDTVPSRLD